MSQERFEQIVSALRASAAAWFNNNRLLDLEALIAEAERLRKRELQMKALAISGVDDAH